MKQLFHLKDGHKSIAENNIVLLEIGDDYCCTAFCGEGKTIQELSYYTFDAPAFNESIAKLLNELKSGDAGISKLVICAAFPQAMLTPVKLYKEDAKEELLGSLYDIGNSHIMKDDIAAWQMVNIYAVPQNLYQTVTAYFSSADFINAYTVLLKAPNEVAAENQILVHFTTTSFSVKVTKNQHLQLMQTFTYTAPLDVVYVLLKISTELQLQQEEVQLILSGLIEEDSALYKELYHYFLHIKFAAVADSLAEENNLPSHFFTSLYNLSACVL